MDCDITVDPVLLDREQVTRTQGFGSYTIMVNTPEAEKVLRARYGRRGLGLKVFKGMSESRILDPWKLNPTWGKVSIEHASIIQNLFAHEGISPRVYGLASVNGILAQVTDYIERTPDPEQSEQDARVRKLEQLIKKYKLVSLSLSPDFGLANWRDNKYIDFSHLDFIDFQAYKDELDIRARTRRGIVLQKAYQPVPPLGIPGSRKIVARIANLKLKTLPFKGTNVLDAGCNLGAFSRYSIDAGARRVIGIDKIGQLTFEVNNLLGYWNLDIVTEDILEYVARNHKSNPRGFKFDIVFLMAVQNYLGGIEVALKAITPVAKNLIIVESHGGESREVYEKIFVKFNFTKVEYLGYVQDPQIRHQWHLYK